MDADVRPMREGSHIARLGRGCTQDAPSLFSLRRTGRREETNEPNFFGS